MQFQDAWNNCDVADGVVAAVFRKCFGEDYISRFNCDDQKKPNDCAKSKKLRFSDDNCCAKEATGECDGMQLDESDIHVTIVGNAVSKKFSTSRRDAAQRIILTEIRKIHGTMSVPCH